MVSAMVNDPEVAEAIAADDPDRDEDAETSSLRSQTSEAVVLQAIFNVLVSALGGKEPWPAPVTEVDRARRRLSRSRALDVVAVMTPWAAEP